MLPVYHLLIGTCDFHPAGGRGTPDRAPKRQGEKRHVPYGWRTSGRRTRDMGPVGLPRNDLPPEFTILGGSGGERG